jgi:hypothetical protein
MDNLEAYKNEGHAGQVGHGLALVLGGRLLRACARGRVTEAVDLAPWPACRNTTYGPDSVSIRYAPTVSTPWRSVPWPHENNTENNTSVPPPPGTFRIPHPLNTLATEKDGPIPSRWWGGVGRRRRWLYPCAYAPRVIPHWYDGGVRER